jgi:hypothetical protein
MAGGYRGDPGKNSADPIIFHPLLKTAYAAQKEEKATFFDFCFRPKMARFGKALPLEPRISDGDQYARRFSRRKAVAKRPDTKA